MRYQALVIANSDADGVRPYCRAMAMTQERFEYEVTRQQQEQDMKQIAAAFIKAKKAFAPAIKNASNPHFKSKYADLAACIEAVDEPFLNAGIAMYQETFEDSNGITVETVLLHESGETMRCGKLHVPASKQDPQGYGSALTYARRYSLMTACGIAPEDDDANSAKPPQSKAKSNALDEAAAIAAMRGAPDVQTLNKYYQSAMERASNAQSATLEAAYAVAKDVLGSV